MKLISIILACYNEQEALPIYFQKIDEIIQKVQDYKFEFILVNDGSKDDTLKFMQELYEKRNDVVVCSFSRNYGQNAAISAGLKVSKGDYCIMMDCDLQDPLELIPKIAEEFTKGYDVVNLHRADRSKDTSFKRDTAGLFYKIINQLEGKQVIPENVNCFRGISRKVVDEILELTEKDKLLLAEIPLVGHATVSIDFTREERSAGQSKYNLKKLIRYSLDNMSTITSRPLYLPSVFGGFFSLFSALFLIVMTVLYILSYPTIHIIPCHEIYMVFFILSFVFLAFGFITFFIGLLGIYLHNILINTRNRPTYIIEKVMRKEEKE